MKILLLTHRVPYPPNRGDRIRSYHLLQFLAQRSDVSLACVTDEPVSDNVERHLKSLCQNIAICPTSRVGRALRSGWSLVAGRSATERYFWHPRLAGTLRDWSRSQKFDKLICYCSGMYRYTRTVELAHVPAIVDLVDVDSQKWNDYSLITRRPVRWLYRVEGQRVRRLEQELADRSQAVIVVSAAEADLLRQRCPHAAVHSIPNGVDLNYFQPDSHILEPDAQRDSTIGRPECVFVGALDYRPNVDGVSWFCHQVWPEIVRRFPQARFVLVGRQPVPQILKLAAQSGVELVGEVPDVRPYLQRATVAVVPLRIARGIQNKVLEALATGTPVVASPSALDGLELVRGEHAYQAETPAQWVNGIGTLLENANERHRLGAAGQAFVRANHRWEGCLRPLEELLGIAKRTPFEALSTAVN